MIGEGKVVAVDGVGVLWRGDAASIVYQRAARLHRTRWLFDQFDVIRAKNPDGVIALMVVLPSADPPDAETRAENNSRLHTMGTSLRRLVTVPIGDAFRTSVVRTIMRGITIIQGKSKVQFICNTIDAGVRELLVGAFRQNAPRIPALCLGRHGDYPQGAWRSDAAEHARARCDRRRVTRRPSLRARGGSVASSAGIDVAWNRFHSRATSTTSTRSVRLWTRPRSFCDLGIRLVRVAPGACETLLDVTRRDMVNRTGTSMRGCWLRWATIRRVPPRGRSSVRTKGLDDRGSRSTSSRPAAGTQVRCRGRKVIRQGRSISFVEAEMLSVGDGEERLVAKSTVTLAIVADTMLQG